MRLKFNRGFSFLLPVALSLISAGCAQLGARSQAYLSVRPLAAVFYVQEMHDRIRIREYYRAFDAKAARMVIDSRIFKLVRDKRGWRMQDGLGRNCGYWRVRHRNHSLELLSAEEPDALFSHQYIPGTQKDLADALGDLRTVNQQVNRWLQSGGALAAPDLKSLQGQVDAFRCH